MELCENVMLTAGWSYARAYFSLSRLLANTTESDAFACLSSDSRLIVSLKSGEGRLCTGAEIAIGGAQSPDDNDEVSFPMQVPSYFAAGNGSGTVFSAHNLPISYIVSFFVIVFFCPLQIAEGIADSIFMNPRQGLSCASLGTGSKWLVNDALLDAMTDGDGVGLSIRRYVLAHLSAQSDHLCKMFAVSLSELRDILADGVGVDGLHYPNLTLSTARICTFSWPICRFFCDHLMHMLHSRAFVTSGAVSGYLIALGLCPFGRAIAQFQAHYGFSLKKIGFRIGGKYNNAYVYVAPNGNALASHTELASRKYYLALPKSLSYETVERDSGVIHTELPPTAVKLGTAGVSKKTLIRTTTMHSKRRREESADLSTCSTIVTNRHQLPRRIDELCDDEVSSSSLTRMDVVESNGMGGSFWGFTRTFVARNTDHRSASGLHNARNVSVGDDVFFGHISMRTFCSPLTGQRFLQAVQSPSSTLSPILPHATVCEAAFFDRYVTRSPKLALNWVGHAVITPAVSNWLSDGQERKPQAIWEDLCVTLPPHICIMSRLYSGRTCSEPVRTHCASKKCACFAESHLSIFCPPELLTQSALPALRSVTFPSMLIILRFGLHDAVVKKENGCLPQSVDAFNASKELCVFFGLQLLVSVSYEVGRLKESVREHVLQASSTMTENSAVVGGCTSLLDGKLLSYACAASEPHRNRDSSKRGRGRQGRSSTLSFFIVDSLYQLSLLLFEKHPLYLRAPPCPFQSIASTDRLTLRTRLLLSLSRDDLLSLFFPTTSTSNLQSEKALSEFFVRLFSEESERIHLECRQTHREPEASLFLTIAFISPLFAHCVALVVIRLLLLDASCHEHESWDTIVGNRLFTFKAAHTRVCKKTSNTCSVCEVLDVTMRYLAEARSPSELPLKQSVRPMLLLQIMFDQAAMPCPHNVHEYVLQSSAVQKIAKARASGDLDRGLLQGLYGTPDDNDCPHNNPLSELFERVYRSANECLSTLFSSEMSSGDAPRETPNATDTDEVAVTFTSTNYSVALHTIRKWIYLRTARDHSAVKLSLLSGVERAAVEALAGTYADGTLKRLRNDILLSSQTQNVKSAHTSTEELLDGLSGDVRKLLSLVGGGECERLLGLPHVANLVCARAEGIVSEVLNAERDTQRQFLENITAAFSECCRAIVEPQDDKPDTEPQSDVGRMISAFETSSRVLCARYLSVLNPHNDLLVIPRCNLLLARARKLYGEALHRISGAVASERIERVISTRVNSQSPPTSSRLKLPTYTYTYAHLLDIIADSSPCVVSEQIAVGIITLEIPYEGMFTTIACRDATSTSQRPATLEEHIFALRALSQSNSAFSVTSLEEDTRYLERALNSCENRFQQLKARKALGAAHPEGCDSEEDQISSTTSCVGEEVLELLRRYCCSLDRALCIFSKAALSSVQACLDKSLPSEDRREDAQGVRSTRLAHDRHLKASVYSLLTHQKEQRCMLSLLRSNEIERVIQKHRQAVASSSDLSSHVTVLTPPTPIEEGRLVVARRRKEGLYSTSLLLVAYDTARLMKRQLCEICALLLELRELSNH